MGRKLDQSLARNPKIGIHNCCATWLHTLAISSFGEVMLSFDSQMRQREEGCDTDTHTHTYIHTYLPTYLPTYIHTYIHSYIHTYIRFLLLPATSQAPHGARGAEVRQSAQREQAGAGAATTFEVKKTQNAATEPTPTYPPKGKERGNPTRATSALQL